MKALRLLLALTLAWLLCAPESRADAFGNRAWGKSEYQSVITPSDEAQTLVRYRENATGYDEIASGQEVWTKTDPDGRQALAVGLAGVLGIETGPGDIFIMGAAATMFGATEYHINSAPAPITAAPPIKQEPSITPAPPISNSTPPSGPVPKQTITTGNAPPVVDTPTEGVTKAAPLPVTTPGHMDTPSGSAIQPDILNSEINGNSAQSPKPQIVYVIRNPDGTISKYGVSGVPPNANGTYPRINQQTKDGKTGKVVENVPGGPGARQKALDIEQQKVDEYAKQNDGNGPPDNIKPKPSDQGSGGAQ